MYKYWLVVVSMLVMSPFVLAGHGDLYPIPELNVNQPNADIYFYITIAVLVVIVFWAIRELITRRNWLPLVAISGGVVSLPLKPMWDVICQFVFPFDTEPMAFTAYGRPIPWHLVTIYPCFIGWGSYQLYQYFNKPGPKEYMADHGFFLCG